LDIIMTTVNKIISLSLAQYRLLGRALRGERLPAHRYRAQHPTMKALLAKGCLTLPARDVWWVPTPIGKEIHACRGVLRPGHRVWDSASKEERDAQIRVQRTSYASEKDRAIVARLQERQRAAGEIE
jgi:hypothetical protein